MQTFLTKLKKGTLMKIILVVVHQYNFAETCITTMKKSCQDTDFHLICTRKNNNVLSFENIKTEIEKDLNTLENEVKLAALVIEANLGNPSDKVFKEELIDFLNELEKKYDLTKDNVFLVSTTKECLNAANGQMYNNTYETIVPALKAAHKNVSTHTNEKTPSSQTKNLKMNRDNRKWNYSQLFCSPFNAFLDQSKLQQKMLTPLPPTELDCKL